MEDCRTSSLLQRLVEKLLRRTRFKGFAAWTTVENWEKLERETGFEPATLSLEG